VARKLHCFKKQSFVHSEQPLARNIFLNAGMEILASLSRSFLNFDFGIKEVYSAVKNDSKYCLGICLVIARFQV